MEGPAIRQLFIRALGFSTDRGSGGSLFRSLGGTTIVWLSGSILSFAVGVQLARVLGVTAYGYYGMALAIITVASVPGEMGLPRLVTREVAAATARDDAGLIYGVLRWADKMTLAIGGPMMAAIALIGLLMVQSGDLRFGRALVWGAPIVVLMTLTRVHGSALQGLHHVVRGQVPFVVLRPLFLSLLVLGAALAGTTLAAWEAMALHSAAAAMCFAITLVWLRNRLPPRPAVIAEGSQGWLRSSIPMGLTEGMRVLQSELSILLVGLIATSAGAGLFRIASVTAVTAALPVSVINYVAFPLVARLHSQGEMAELQRRLTQLARLQFAGVFLLCLPLLIFAEPLLGLVFGADYVPAANALRILAAGQIASAALGPGFVLLNMTHQERRATSGIVAAVVANLLLLPVLATFWGIVGAAAAVSLSLFLWNALNWINGHRHLGLEVSILPVRSSPASHPPAATQAD